MTFTPGQRVMTPLGPGAVSWQRNAPPDYRQAAAVSVRLDARVHDPRYTGTIFPAESIQPQP